MEVTIKCSGSSELPLSALNPFQGDLKSLSKENYLKIKNSLLKHGFISPFHVWNGNILDGHQRLRALRVMAEEGIPIPGKFPIVEISAPDEKTAKKIILSLSSQYGKMTEESLFEFSHDLLEFEELSESFEFDAIEMDHFEKNFYDKPIGEAEGEDDVPEDAPTISKLGDIWHLGNHRIMNADCTVEENVKRLMGDEKADMVFTDPPYGVDLSSKNEMLNSFDKGGRVQTPIENDNIENYREFFASFLKIIPLADYNTVYITVSSVEIHNLRLGSEDAGFHWSDYIIWAKNNHILGRKDYNSKVEFIYYGWKGRHKFYGGFQTTLFEFDRPLKSPLHPTMKPIGLIEKFLNDGSISGMKVYDAFLGSGSTLIACEKTNRKCYSMEISPEYVDVAVKRFADFTHQSDNIYLERDGEKIPYTQLLNQ